MPDSAPSPAALSFADGEDLSARPDSRPRWHPGRLACRIECWREKRLVRNALELAGVPTLVLDLSHVTGRYWPLLAEHPGRVIIAAVDSPALAESRLHRQPLPIRERIRVLQASAFAFNLPDNSVDCVFCMRPMIGNGRQDAILRELHRVTRDSVILAARAEVFGSFQRDCTAAGFRLLGRFDLLPLFSTVQVAVLRKSN